MNKIVEDKKVTNSYQDRKRFYLEIPNLKPLLVDYELLTVKDVLELVYCYCRSIGVIVDAQTSSTLPLSKRLVYIEGYDDPYNPPYKFLPGPGNIMKFGMIFF